MDIEGIAIDEIKRVLRPSDYLVCHLETNDKTPSWDGTIDIYQTPGNNHKKSDLICPIHVQVKGKTLHKVPKRKRKTRNWTYPIDIEDLNNYNKIGGTIFFVVHIGPKGICLGKFYTILLPFELQKILNQKGGKKSRSVPLIPLPNLQTDIDDLFLNMAEDLQKQNTSRHLNFEEVYTNLKKLNKPIPYTLSFKTTASNNNELQSLDYLFSHSVYQYTQLENGIQIPLGRVILTEAKKTTCSVVKIGNDVYYYKEDYSITQENETITIGKSLTIQKERKSDADLKINFSLSGLLHERIRDLKFTIHLLEYGSFEIGNLTINLLLQDIEHKELVVKKQRAILGNLEELQNTLDDLDVHTSIDIDNLTEEDDENLQSLVYWKQNGVECEKYNSDIKAGLISCAGMKILVALKRKTDSQIFQLFNFNDFTETIYLPDDNGVKYPTKLYLGITVEFILAATNLNLDKIVNHIILSVYDESVSTHVNYLLLNMLSAFDKSGDTRIDIIKAAIKLSDWMKNNDTFTNKYTTHLNYYQSLKRVQTLTDENKNCISNFLDELNVPMEVCMACHLLLDEPASAKRYFSKMDEKLQKAYREMPIFRFWPKN